MHLLSAGHRIGMQVALLGYLILSSYSIVLLTPACRLSWWAYARNHSSVWKQHFPTITNYSGTIMQCIWKTRQGYSCEQAPQPF